MSSSVVDRIMPPPSPVQVDPIMPLSSSDEGFMPSPSPDVGFMPRSLTPGLQDDLEANQSELSDNNHDEEDKYWMSPPPEMIYDTAALSSA